MTSLRGLATRVGLGSLAQRCYHQPLGRLRQSVDEGGPFEQSRTAHGRLEMIAAAGRLTPMTPPPGDPLTVHFLSGANYWWQTLFCLLSLQTHSPSPIAAVVHDDGSFDDETWGAIARAAPLARLEAHAEIETRLDAHLPRSRYPALRARRLTYPHLRKLTDIHAGRAGWRAVLDSDMLFFRHPRALLDWLAAPARPCHLLETKSAYGYAAELMAELAGAAPPARVNVGIVGLRSDAIDWDRVEFWCAQLQSRAGPLYLQEQALTAMLLTGRDCLRLPEADYRVLPGVSEGRAPTAALHHYVAHSKRSYFQHGWRRALSDAGIEAPS